MINLKKIICFISFFIFFWGCASQDKIIFDDNEKQQSKIMPEEDSLKDDSKKDNSKKDNSKAIPCYFQESRTMPDWIEKPPHDNFYIYGVGAAPKQSSVLMQIKAAKILAKNDIALQIKTHIKSILDIKTSGNNEFSETDVNQEIIQKTQAMLRGVEIVDVWKDENNCVIYALAKVLKDNNKEADAGIVEKESNAEITENESNTDINKKKSNAYINENESNAYINENNKEYKTENSFDSFESKKGKIIKNITAEGSCAILGMDEKQAQNLALHRARAGAIEKACGILVSSSKIVTSGVMVLDFINSYSKGYIVRENYNWLPADQYQKDPQSPPIFEYRVNITADVYIPENVVDQIGLTAKLDKRVFNEGEKVTLEINTRKQCNFAIFNFQADDLIYMIYPHMIIEPETLMPYIPFRLPLSPETLPGYKQNAEALFIVGAAEDKNIDFKVIFPQKAMAFTEFFEKYSKIASNCTDKIISYQVNAK